MIPFLLSVIARALLSLRYRIRTQGLKDIAAKGKTGILFLPNHPALIDPVILIARLYQDFRPRSLADIDRINYPLIHGIALQAGARPMPAVKKRGEASKGEIQRVIQESIDGLKRGENLLLYPSGHTTLTRLEDLGGNSALTTILEQIPNVRIVLVRDRGLWGSRFSWASGRDPHLLEGLRAGFFCLLANLIFFTPRRDVSLEFVEPADLPRTAGRSALNRYLENFYNLDAPYRTYVPYTFWEGGQTQVLPEPEPPRIDGNLNDVSAATRELVIKKLRELSGMATIPDTAELARDLSLDSLARLELQVWLEKEFGFQGIDPESLQKVSDVLLAAHGSAISIGGTALKPIPKKWFQQPNQPVKIAEGVSLTEVFLNRAAQGPGRPVLADQTSGVKTYRDIVTAILALKPHLEALEGAYVGLMLPATVAAGTFYLALLFAGKIPVMVNWTLGMRNLAYSLDLLGVKQVLTAGALISKIASQGTDLSPIQDKFVKVEELGRSLGTVEKLSAALRARLSWSSLRKPPASKIAVVLFTSGSESLPKAVPLTHANLLTNLRDLLAAVQLVPGEKMLGILPPFHSFGLTTTLLLPLCGGASVVYHPNPTEGLALAKIMDAYQVTMMIGTPTFLQGIVRAARNEKLEALQLVVTGAEKCPAALYEALDRRWPKMMVLEGYGITECSPVVSVNRKEGPRRGTIGYLLPSLEYAVQDLDTGRRCEPGRTGMLLVRGPSIFDGYLNFSGNSPFEEFEGRTWYRTGDLVRAASDGLLTFSGRLKRFVKLGGEMVSLPAVEEALLARFGGERDEEIILAVETTSVETNPELVLFTIRDISREAANTAIRAAGLSPLHNVRFVKNLEHIPLLGTGKTDYRALQAMLK